MEHKILLVDDDRDLLEMLCSIFRRAGYTELVTASSGQEALKVWREQQPALIVLDEIMPRSISSSVENAGACTAAGAGRSSSVAGVIRLPSLMMMPPLPAMIAIASMRC